MGTSISKLAGRMVLGLFVGSLATQVHAGAFTCLTGTDPSVASDKGNIMDVSDIIDGQCSCGSFDGTKGKTHTAYNACVAAAAKQLSEPPSFEMRPQCVGFVKRRFAKSTCGLNPTRQPRPCITTSLKSGKVACSIKATLKSDGITPSLSCTDTTSATRSSCADHHQCLAAGDTNFDLKVGSGDDGGCALPPGSYQFTCSGCIVAAGDTALVCTCLDAMGSPVNTSLALPCNGLIGNDNGNLECAP